MYVSVSKNKHLYDNENNVFWTIEILVTFSVDITNKKLFRNRYNVAA